MRSSTRKPRTSPTDTPARSTRRTPRSPCSMPATSSSAARSARVCGWRRPARSPGGGVAPAGAIAGGTAGELAGAAPTPEEALADPVTFLVFAKLDPRGTLTHLGQVEAASRAQALDGARL